MNNRELYKSTFSKVNSSTDYLRAIENGEKKHAHHSWVRKVTVAFATIVLLFASIGTVYALDVGGVQRMVQIWMDGDLTDATIEKDEEGAYLVTYKDIEGNLETTTVGGVACNDDGTIRELTEEEIVFTFGEPKILTKDGITILSCQGKVFDITEQVQQKLPLYITIETEKDTYYIVVKNAYSIIYMTTKYPDID